MVLEGFKGPAGRSRGGLVRTSLILDGGGSRGRLATAERGAGLFKVH